MFLETKSAPQNDQNRSSNYKLLSSQDNIDHNNDIFQVSYQNMENFVRYANFKIGRLHVGVRVCVLIIVCATSSIYQITPKLKILVFINSCIQPIIIVGSTILVQDFVPSFRAPKVNFELPSTFAIARYSSRVARGFGPFPVRPQEVSALFRFGPFQVRPSYIFCFISSRIALDMTQK